MNIDERVVAYSCAALTLAALVLLAALYGFGACALSILAITTTLISALILSAHRETT